MRFFENPTKALELFNFQGFHIEPRLIPQVRCEALISAAMTMPTALDGSFSPIAMPHRAHPEFLGIIKYIPMVNIVEKLVDGHAAGIGGEFFFMPPGTPGFTLHQDNHYIQATPPDAFISAWIALCDVDEDNGCLIFFPGSHKLGELPTREGDNLVTPSQNPGARQKECVLPEEMSSKKMVLQKGDVVFFHSLLAHKSVSNCSPHKSRYSQVITYIKSGTPFRRGGRQQREEIALYDH